jgi:hypothetical protein
VGDPAGMDMAWLRTEVRHRIGGAALQMPDEVAVLVDMTLRYWPERHMAELARKSAGNEDRALDALAVVAAKIRETVEAMCAAARQNHAVDLLAFAVVVEVANLWFASTEHRIGLRRLAFQVRQRPAA